MPIFSEISGIIDHRILLNFRIDPDVIQAQIPSDFKPKIVKGYAIAGVCQVSLSSMAPLGIPRIIQTSSHNIAHRVAVDTPDGEGVYIIRYDTNSKLNKLSGGRLFPGVYGLANFNISSKKDNYVVDIRKSDDSPLVLIDASLEKTLPEGSVFKDADELSLFFKNGNIGWSSSIGKDRFDSVELKTNGWNMEPLLVLKQFSEVFSDQEKYPSGSVQFDSAMIMRNISHSWVSRPELSMDCC